jgi:hypothetical protein
VILIVAKVGTVIPTRPVNPPTLVKVESAAAVPGVAMDGIVAHLSHAMRITHV